MLEKKKIFIDAFNKKADDDIKLLQEKVANYSEFREKAIALTDPISLSFDSPNTSFTTIGELFAWIYSKDGGSENIPDAFISIILPIIAGKDSSGKELYKELHKTFSAKTKLEKAEEIRLVGGEKWFDDFNKSAIIKMSAVNQKISDYKNVDDFEEAEHLLYEEPIAHRPSGIINQLYEAFVEAGSQPIGSSEVKSPINTTEPKKEIPSKSPINEDTPTPKNKEVSPVNPPVSAPETKSEAPKAGGTVVAEKELLPKEEKQSAKQSSVTVNVENAPSKTETPSKIETSNSSTINDIKSSVTNNAGDLFRSFFETSQNLQNIKEGKPVESPVINESKPTTINNTNASANSNINNTNASANSNINNTNASAINSSLTKSETTNSTSNANLNTSNKESVTSNINSSDLIKSDNLESTENTTINQSSNIISDFYSEAAKLDKVKLENSKEPSKISNSKAEENAKSNNKLEVIKSKELIPPNIAPLSSNILEKTIQKTESTTPEINVTPVIKPTSDSPISSESPKTVEANAPIESSESGGQSSVNIDMSEVANRLKRIERLLIGPLEVKIVQ